ncbi:MAG: thioredoxin [Nitrososphaerota archaeon]|jgi:thioredoxin 1|nr:thioredoxin [Nitrososphaerota archaeon]
MQAETIKKISGDDFQRSVFGAPEPVVVDFYADWCPPCKMVSPILEGLSEEYRGKVSFVKVNVDEEAELASQFGIMSIPTVVFFAKGKVSDAVIGAVPATTYREKLEQAIRSSTTVG